MIRLGLSAAVLGLAGLGGATMACAGQEPEGTLRSRVERLIDRGRADEAVALARRVPADSLAATLGDALAARGRLADARAAFERAARSPGSERRYAAARIAELAERTGRYDAAARGAADLLRSIDPGSPLSAADWLAYGIASRLAGRADPARFKDALDAFDRALAGDSTWLEPALRVGDLFLDKYNAPDAKDAYTGLMRHDPGNPRALLGLAAVRVFNGDPGGYAATVKAVEAAPGLPAATALLARLDLDAEAFDSATARAGRAIELDSTALEAWAVLGAADLLRDDTTGYRRIESGVRVWNPAPVPFYVAIAEALGRQRRYAQAASLGRVAVGLAPDDPGALTVLGTNQLRLGMIDSGRASLERAFARDPYHVWNKNTLDLLDQLATYRTVSTRRFQLVGAPREIEILGPYLEPILEHAFDSLANRYHYRPPTPVRLEIYSRHADFSVRTVGLVGLGALGVSFGSVLAMDAPSARERGDFNWGSTAWHELAHAFTLGVSDHKVPRWLSEGLSVFEERRARAGWGANATLAFLSAYKGGKLKPVSILNDGFVRPDSPMQVPWSYYEASLVCEFVTERWGFDAILGMLDGYRRGLATPDVFRTVLQLEPEALDRQFDAWFRARFAGALEQVGAARDSSVDAGELGTLLRSGAALLAQGRTKEAIGVLERVEEAFPAQGDGESAAWLLTQAYQRQGDTAKALAQVDRATRYNDTQLDANRLEAALRTASGDRAGAMAALERAIFIDPYDPVVHAQLAALASATGAHEEAVRERKVILALDPTDKAEAGYQLAVAYRDAGDLESARRQVLRVLEAAPSFERAQTLLLELRRP